MQMECKLCLGHDANKLIDIDARCAIFVCKTCKNAFTSPEPLAVDYTNLDFHKKAQENAVEKPTMLENLPWDWKHGIELQVEMLSSLLPPQANILEIGCGEGILLNELQQRGFSVCGVEPSTSGVARAKQRGLNVVHGYYSGNVLQEKFSCVVMSHVLEHLAEPAQFLETVIGNLKPDGIIMLVQTNYQGIIPRVKGKRWYAWVADHHYWHFSVSGLNFLLNKVNYTPIGLKYCSLVHNHGALYKLSQVYHKFGDQIIAAYKPNQSRKNSK